jgi:hypothetical protein
MIRPNSTDREQRDDRTFDAVLLVSIVREMNPAGSAFLRNRPMKINLLQFRRVALILTIRSTDRKQLH